MTTQNSLTEFLKRSKGWLMGVLGAALFVALAAWGGVPHGVSTAVFLGGVLVLLLVIGGLGVAGWHLLKRPLPPGHKLPAIQSLPAAIRQLLAFLLVTSGFAWIVGGFWDEVWHRTYGVPFGEDFFWRPHMLIYYSIGSATLLAAGSFYYLLKHGRGTWQQRFRANPLLGLLVLLGSFMAFAIPADPVWHFIYGEDLTAWSIPHIVLIFSFVGVLLLAIATHTSGTALGRWGWLWRMPRADWLVIFAVSLILNTLLQGMTTDWEGASLSVLQSRPEWLLPATLVAIALFCGTLTAHSLRRVWAATTVGLVALLVRQILRLSFAYEAITINAWLCTLAPLLAVDVWLAVGLWRERPSGWFTIGLAGLVGLAAVTFPLINQFYAYPTIAADNLPIMLLTCMIAALGAAWVGQTVGDYFAAENKQVGGETAVSPSYIRYLSPIIAALALIFVAFFIATAAPPV
ncbi:MAG: hypothetical protein KC433_03755 [Anaerolineales bacterium]|nr:hypothetical protein [Anaerolineales bacterium]MCB8939303.1 hypothetical protein [Ardenticatenaceae bacterium]